MTRATVLPLVTVAFTAALLTGCAGGTATPAAQGSTRTVTGSPAPPASAAPPATEVPPSPAPRLPPPGSPPPTPATGSGIAGLTTIDGGCPVLRAESPCPDRAVTARMSIVDAESGRVVATVASDAAGRFRVALGPGRYLIHLLSIGGGPPHPQMPATVTVTAGHYTTVTLRFDTGIR